MDDNAIHEWLIKCFGPIQGEMAWQQISQLPEEIREQLMSQDPSRLPNPSEVQQMMAAFSAGGLNTMGDMQRTVEEGPINVKLAKSIALQLQFAYYLFLCDDPASAAQVLEMAHKAEPGNDEVLRNLCSCLSRAGQYELAVTRLQTLLQRVPDDFHALDALCASLAKLDRHDEAAQAGTRSLTLKARSASKAPPSWSPTARSSSAPSSVS